MIDEQREEQAIEEVRRVTDERCFELLERAKAVALRVSLGDAPISVGDLVQLAQWLEDTDAAILGAYIATERGRGSPLGDVLQEAVSARLAAQGGGCG